MRRGLGQYLRDLTGRPMSAVRNRLNYRRCRCPQARDHSHHLTWWWHLWDGRGRHGWRRSV